MKDFTRVYNSNIKDSVQKIRQFCNENNIPYFVAFGVKDDAPSDEQTMTGTEVLQPVYDMHLTCDTIIPEAYDIKTDDHRFADFVNLAIGLPIMENNENKRIVPDGYDDL